MSEETKPAPQKADKAKDAFAEIRAEAEKAKKCVMDIPAGEKSAASIRVDH
jgi:hypothetical protein